MDALQQRAGALKATFMDLVKAQPTKATELFWLSQVTASCQPLSELCPIGVRHAIFRSFMGVAPTVYQKSIRQT
jgi:hypothetical protein